MYRLSDRVERIILIHLVRRRVSSLCHLDTMGGQLNYPKLNLLVLQVYEV